MPGDRHSAIFERFCRDTITDVLFAALAIERVCEGLTFDRDFARFPGLKWSVPG